MYDNGVNAGQFNNSGETPIQSYTSKLDRLQNMVSDMRLRAGLAIADASQKVVRGSSFSGAVSFGANSIKNIGENAKQAEKLGKSVKETQGLLSKFPKSFDEFQKKATDAFKASDTALGSFRKTLIGTEKVLESLATATFVTKTLDILVKSFKDLQNEINRVNSSFKILNKAGFDPSLLQSIKEFETALTDLNFQSTEEFATSFVAQYSEVTEMLSKVGTLIPERLKKARKEGTDELGKLFDDMQKMVGDSLKNTVTSADAISAYYTALQAGIGGDGNEQAVNSAVENTLKLVATQGGDANQIMELLTQTMTAFNLSANSTGDILGKLNKLVDVGITNIPELSYGFGQLGVAASSAGVNLDEMTGAIAALTLSGSNTFSAMTGLQNLFNKIVSGSVTDRLSELSITLNGQAVRFDANSVSAKGFAQSIDEVNRALGGSKELWQQVLGGDQEATRAVFGVLKREVKGLKDLIDQISTAGVKNLEEAFNIKIENDKILQFQQVLNRVTEIALRLGKILAPLFSKGLDKIEKNIERIEYLVKNYGNLIVKLVELNLQLKLLNSAFGILISTVMKLAGAYLVWQVATGKLLRNGILVFQMITNQNKALATNNILWDKNTSLFKKVIATFGQLLGFYSLEKAGKEFLTKQQQQQIEKESKLMAVKATAHKELMDQLKEQQEQYEKIKAIREGKGVGFQNVNNQQRILKSDIEELEKQKSDLQDKITFSTPDSDDNKKYKKQLEEVEGKIKTNKEIIAENNKKINYIEKLDRTDPQGRKQIDLYRKGIKDLEDKERNNIPLTKAEKGYLKRGRQVVSDYDDYQLAVRAANYTNQDEYEYRKNLKTQQYAEENQNKKGFQRQVKRQNLNKDKEAVTEYERLWGKNGIYADQAIEQNKRELERNQNRLKVYDKDDVRYKRAARELKRQEEEIERKLVEKSRYKDAKQNLFDASPIGGLKAAGKDFGDFTKKIEKNIKDLVTGSISALKPLVTWPNVLRLATGGLVALTAAMVVMSEKSAQKARDMLEKAGLDKEDKDIVSIWDALKQQLVSIGGWITDFINAGFSSFKEGFGTAVDFIIAKVLDYPKSIVRNINFIKLLWANLFNFIADKLNFLGLNIGKYDIENLKQEQQAQLDEIDRYGKRLADSFKKPIDDAGNAFSNFLKDVTYAVTEANEDIARGKIEQKRVQLGTELDRQSRELSNVKYLNKGADFGNVEVTLSGQTKPITTNVSDALRGYLNQGKISQTDVENYSVISNETKSKLQKDINAFQANASAQQKIIDFQTQDAFERSGLKGADKTTVEEYVKNRVVAEEMKSTLLTEKKDVVSSMSEQAKALFQSLVNNPTRQLTIGEQKIVKSLTEQQQQLFGQLKEINAKTTEGFTPEQLQTLNKLTPAQSQIFEKLIKDTGEASRFNKQANDAVKTLNDLSNTLNATQTFLKNISDAGDSRNPDARRARLNLDNQEKNIGNSVDNFAKTLSALSNTKYSKEEIINMAKTKPDEYKKFLQSQGVNFAQAGNIFQEMEKNVPSLIQTIADNAAQGFGDDTNKAGKLENVLQNQFMSKFKAQGFDEKEAKRFTDALLATQKIRQQIMSLEEDDFQKYVDRINKRKELYDTMMQSEYLVTKQVIQQKQKLEIEAAEKSVSFYKERFAKLKALNTADVDPNVLKQAETNLQIAEKQLMIKRIEQKKEMLAYETEMIKTEYENRYAELQIQVLKGEKSLTPEERIEMEAEQQQKILQLNLDTQIKLREQLKQSGQLTKEQELKTAKEINNAKLQLINAYIEEANQKYEALANKIEITASAEIGSIDAAVRKLGLKAEMYDRINNIISQQKDLLDTTQDLMDRDMGWLRENVISRRKQIEFEKQYIAQKEAALARQIAFERESLEIQKEQNKILIEKLKREQAIEELKAKKDLKIAMIQEEQAAQSGDPLKQMEAKAEREKAELNYSFAILNRDNVALQIAEINNKQKIDEWKQGIREQTAYDDLEKERAQQTLTRKDDYALTQQISDRFTNGWYPQMPVLDKPTINTGVREGEAQTAIDQVKAETMPQINKIKTELKNNINGIESEQLKVQQEMLKELQAINGKKTNHKKETNKSDDEKINEVMRKTASAMLEMSGKKVDESLLPKISFTNKKEGGVYWNDKRLIELNPELKKDVLAGKGEGLSVLIHELRHWMQYEGLTNGRLNTDKIKDPNEREWAKTEGLKFSGKNEKEEDAYAFQQNYDEILEKIIGGNYLIKNIRENKKQNLPPKNNNKNADNLKEEIKRKNNEYYKTIDNLSSLIDVKNNVKPDDRIKQLKNVVNKKIREAERMHENGIITKEQSDRMVSDWRKLEKDSIPVLKRGVLDYEKESKKQAGNSSGTAQEKNNTDNVLKEQLQVQQKILSYIEKLYNGAKEAVKVSSGSAGKTTVSLFNPNENPGYLKYDPNTFIDVDYTPTPPKQGAADPIGGYPGGRTLPGTGGYLELKPQPEAQYPGGTPNKDWTKEEYYRYLKWLRETKYRGMTVSFADPEDVGITKSENESPNPYIMYNKSSDNSVISQLYSNPENKQFRDGLMRSLKPQNIASQNKMGETQSSGAQNTNNKNVTISLNPNINITIGKDADKAVAKNTAEEINKHLFNLFNEVSYKL